MEGSPAELQKYLHSHIPLSASMNVDVMEAHRERVVLSAPLAPNINHRDTVFGGSSSALAILAAWSLLRVRLGSEGISCRIVIRRNTMSYELPIFGEFTAVSFLTEPSEWDQFINTFTRKRKARIRVSSVLNFEDRIAARFEGEFVAIS